MLETTAVVKLDTIKRVKNFIEVVTKYDEEITIKSHRYEVDAKSIMAIFSLNLLEPVNVCLYCDDSSVVKRFVDEMKGFEKI